MGVRPSLQQFHNDVGIIVYRLPVEAFPNHFTNCYLVLADEKVILIDAATGREQANQDLIDAFAAVRETYNEKVTLADITHLILTHGHIDHFGGTHFIKKHAPHVLVGIHELDARVVERLDERVIHAAKNVEVFLARAGVPAGRVSKLVEMNKWSKGTFAPLKIDFVIDPYADEPLLDLFRVYHAPGHCPGQVCLQMGDILFSADHILARITPVQFPETITQYTGLGHYLDALREIRQVTGVKLILGGHEAEVNDLVKRVDEMRHFHELRLEKVLEICREPKTINEISKALFPDISGYNIILALMETGAHVEYLYHRGRLTIPNVDQIENERDPILQYRHLGR